MCKGYARIKACVEEIKRQTSFVPKVGIVLGSGLGSFGDGIDLVCQIPYATLPDFPISTVPGHAGRFLLGTLAGVPVICMQGRVHYYEGYAMEDVVLPIRVMAALGIESLLLTNAAGGMGQGFAPGDLMLLTDHIATFVPNPLRGENLEEIGTRFPDMSQVYDLALQKNIEQAAASLNIPLQKGVYVQLSGPSYESPAEIRLLKALGADAVGMSTAVEAIAARHAGLRVAAISCITNLAAGLSEKTLNHAEVQETADRAGAALAALLTESVKIAGGV